MKALAVDSASSAMTICAKNGDDRVSLTLDIGPTQSQELLPAIDYVLNKLHLKPSELDYMTLCKGPGTFTGLRLAFAALKSIELAFNIDIWGVSTLECYAHPYRQFNGQVIATIDAKKNQFFAAIYENGKTVMEAQDTDIKKVCSNLDKSKQILCTGPDAENFCTLLKNENPELNVICFSSSADPCTSLFEIAEKMIAEKKEPLKDYEGPEYLRKSEAELALEK
jgi:tRNA threonylcarbamoyladenosine biosynthesis protein TsaB